MATDAEKIAQWNAIEVLLARNQVPAQASDPAGETIDLTQVGRILWILDRIRRAEDKAQQSAAELQRCVQAHNELASDTIGALRESLGPMSAFSILNSARAVVTATITKFENKVLMARQS
jgi:hypothetical protein